MMRRRAFLEHGLGLAAAAASLPSLAQYTAPGLNASPTGVVVLMLANFHCSRSRGVNDHFDRMKSAAEEVGLGFRFAPVAWEGQSLWPDRVYYAVRDLYPHAEGVVRDALFDGVQREGLMFEELSQVMAFFERRQLVQRIRSSLGDFNLAAIAERALDDVVMVSEMKAGRLLNLSGAVEVPVFVWVQGGDITEVITPAQASEPVPLVQLVLRAIKNTATS